jgi:hypothetical protein
VHCSFLLHSCFKLVENNALASDVLGSGDRSQAGACGGQLKQQRVAAACMDLLPWTPGSKANASSCHTTYADKYCMITCLRCRKVGMAGSTGHLGSTTKEYSS